MSRVTTFEVVKVDSGSTFGAPVKMANRWKPFKEPIYFFVYIMFVFMVLIFFGDEAEAAEVFVRNIPATQPGEQQCTPVSGAGVWYYRMTAVDAEANESGLSNEVIKTDATEVCWMNPTENVDGTALTDLVSLNLYQSSGTITDVGGSGPPPVITDAPILRIE
jgi:hypothetical protein